MLRKITLKIYLKNGFLGSRPIEHFDIFCPLKDNDRKLSKSNNDTF